MSGSLTADAVGRLQAELASLQKAPGLPAREALPTWRVLQMLSAADAPAKQPPGPFMELLRRQLHELSKTGETPTGSQLRNAAWVLWNGDPRGVLIPGLFDRVIGYASESRSTLRYLIEAWISDFERDAPGVAEGGQAIRLLLHRGDNPRLVSWRKADERFSLFEAQRGPSLLARAILTEVLSVSAVLEEAGFADALRAVSGYLRAVQEELLRQLPLELRGTRAEERSDRALLFLTHQDKLRFDDRRIDVAKGLCAPWRKPGVEPGGGVQEKVKTFLVRRIGNPQISEHLWVGAEEEAKIVRRWLARASLKLFFELIADQAKKASDSSVDYQWRYREAFWTACLEKGFIDDAWLILGAAVQQSVKARVALTGAYSELAGGGRSQSHAAILIRIGPLTICEWSNNGPMRAWTGADAPKISRAPYRRSDLERICLGFPDPRYPGLDTLDRTGLAHRGSASGTWQIRAAMMLAKYAGVQLSARDWQLK